jgi:hypothetical protein
VSHPHPNGEAWVRHHGGSGEAQGGVGGREGGDGVAAAGIQGSCQRAKTGVAGHHHHGVGLGNDPDANIIASWMAKSED